MLIEKMRKEAARYRKAERIEGGYVVLYLGWGGDKPEAEGWLRALDCPAAFLPGKSFAVAVDGAVWAARDGNDYDGAKVWKPYEGPM